MVCQRCGVLKISRHYWLVWVCAVSALFHLLVSYNSRLSKEEVQSEENRSQKSIAAMKQDFP